ncbi:hypothetical protein SLA2020_265080 [Shorea laevis]
MDSSSQNWLGFSLSNHPHSHLPSHSSPLSLFHAFTSPTQGTVVDETPEKDATAGATDLSMFTAGPKLEDFLGGSTATAGATSMAQFSNETSPMTLTISEPEMYDSELKTIAASFLRPQTQPLKKPLAAADPPPKKAVDTFGQRTSIYRGVTRHRWTGRYEAHLWDNSCRREGQSRKGRQDSSLDSHFADESFFQAATIKKRKAARAYDLAALKYWGPTTTTNFPVSNYEKELEEMKTMTRQEFVASLRRKSSGFSRGASIYRGVTRHHQHGRWQARIGRVAGNKDLYLGTFSTQEEAAEAYDIAAIKFRGLNAVTNFDMSRYDVKSIANSNLPIGGMSGKSKNSSESASDSKSVDGGSRSDDRDLSSASSITFASQPSTSSLSFAIPIKQDPSDYCGGIFNGGYVQQQNNNVSSIPFATPIALSSSNSYESSSGYGSSWIGPALHTFQTHAKPSLFQTPIFGIE